MEDQGKNDHRLILVIALRVVRCSGQSRASSGEAESSQAPVAGVRAAYATDNNSGVVRAGRSATKVDYMLPPISWVVFVPIVIFI